MKTLISHLHHFSALLFIALVCIQPAVAQQTTIRFHFIPALEKSALFVAQATAMTPAEPKQFSKPSPANSLIGKESKKAEKDQCDILDILPFIVCGVFILALLSSCKAPPTAIRAGTQINILFCIEYLLHTIGGYVHFEPWAELLFNTGVMACILPVHFYLYSACSNFLLLHPLLPTIKHGLITLCKGYFRL